MKEEQEEREQEGRQTAQTWQSSIFGSLDNGSSSTTRAQNSVESAFPFLSTRSSFPNIIISDDMDSGSVDPV